MNCEFTICSFKTFAFCSNTYVENLSHFSRTILNLRPYVKQIYLTTLPQSRHDVRNQYIRSSSEGPGKHRSTRTVLDRI